MKSIPLSEVAEITMGQSPPSETYNKDGDGLPFFQGKADFGDLFPTIRIYCNAPKKIAQKGDILISVRAPVGPTNINPTESCIGRGLASIRAKNKIDTKYLLYFLRYFEPRLAESSKGSTFDAIGREDLANLSLPLPTLSEQQRIAAIIYKADRLRRLRRYALELSDSYLQSVFLKMFGDPVANPTGWKKQTLPRIINPDRPITYGILKPGPEISNGIPYVRVVDIRNNRILVDQVRHTSQKIAQRYKRSMLEPKDLLISIRGHVGRLAKVPSSLDGANITQDTARLAPIPELCDVDYLMGCLNTRQMQGYLANQIKGVAVQGINLGDLKILQVPIPPLPLQKNYARVVERFERLRSRQREALRQAEHLFISLLHYIYGSRL